jgi:hypothetical protein
MRTTFMAIGRKIVTLTRLSAPERRRAFGAIALMALVRTALWVLPFRWIRRFVEAGLDRLKPVAGSSPPRNIVWAVRLAARYVPGASCLTQALTAQLLLSWCGIASRLHVGVSRAQNFEAHAWLEYNGRVLLGGEEESSRYSPILILEGREARN